MMDGAHFHLMLNHFPIAGMVFSIGLLAIAGRMDSDTLKRAALLLVVVTGLLTIPAFLTGEPAEKVVEHFPNVTKAMIEAHEEAAEKGAWAVWITSGVAMAGLILSFKRKVTAGWVIPVVLILSLGCVGLFAWSNNLGGQISHSELRAK
jgi:uncharacterized membrane protein